MSNKQKFFERQDATSHVIREAYAMTNDATQLINSDNTPAANFHKALRSNSFRFAVGAPSSPYSSTWTAWSKGSDYYLATRQLAGNIKISLHSSGRYRLALTTEQIARMTKLGITVPSDRAFVKWSRPPVPDEGATLIALLSFPTDFLTQPEARGTEKKPLVIFMPAPAGSAVEVGFFISREPAASLEDKLARIGMPLVRTDLEDGTSISIVAHFASFNSEAIPNADALRQNLKPLVPHADLEDENARRNLTMLFWNQPHKNEHLTMIEVGGVSIDE